MAKTYKLSGNTYTHLMAFRKLSEIRSCRWDRDEQAWVLDSAAYEWVTKNDGANRKILKLRDAITSGAVAVEAE